MGRHIKVSIITPSFQQREFIERTLLSVIHQKLSSELEYEHLVFDGGSTDGTLEILKKYTNYICWISQKDKGQSDAVNQGFLSAKGEIIGWLNSDDIYYPNVIHTVVEYFNNNPKIDVVYGMANYIDRDDNIIKPYPTEKWDYARLLDVCYICQPTVFFRRKIIESSLLLDDSLEYCMDYEYWLRLGRSGFKFGYLPEIIAGSRLYAENKSLRAKEKVLKETNEMLLKQIGHVPNQWILNYAHKVVDSNQHKFIFPIKIFFISLFAELYWNKKISFSMIKRFNKHIFYHLKKIKIY